MENLDGVNSEIYIKIDGKIVACVEKYEEKAVFDNLLIETIGESAPVANLRGKERYNIEFSKSYIYTGLMGGEQSLFNKRNFELTVVMPKKNVVYSGCEWTNISTNIGVNNLTADTLNLTAVKREEVIQL